MGSHPWLADSCKGIIPDAISVSHRTAQKSTKVLVQEQLLQDKSSECSIDEIACRLPVKLGEMPKLDRIDAPLSGLKLGDKGLRISQALGYRHLSPDLRTWGWDRFAARACHYWRKSNNRGEMVHSRVRISHDTRFFRLTSVLAEF